MTLLHSMTLDQALSRYCELDKMVKEKEKENNASGDRPFDMPSAYAKICTPQGKIVGPCKAESVP